MTKILRKLKKRIKLFIKSEYPFKTQLEVKHEWLGSLYGGFYIDTRHINNNSIVYSFGVGEDISFDTQLIRLTGCTVHGFDPTPKSINWIKGNNELPCRFIFHDFGLDIMDRQSTFYLPKNKDYVSGSIVQNTNLENEGIRVSMKCIKSICKELGHTSIDVLKMDIEGSEYQVIPGLISSGIAIKQLLVEFHHRFFEDGFRKNDEIIAKLNHAGFKIFAVSDTLDEVSFINTGI